MAPNAFGGIVPTLFAPVIVASSPAKPKRAATMRILLKKQLSILVVASGFAALEAGIATNLVAKQSHGRHRSVSAERIADKGRTWNNPNYGYASAAFRDSRHYYPDPFHGDCTLDDGPFPCGSDP